MMTVPSIPEEAEQIYDRMEEFYDWRIKLTNIVDWSVIVQNFGWSRLILNHLRLIIIMFRYNKMKKNCRPEELSIMTEEIEAINNEVYEAMEKINWKSEGKRNEI